MDHLVTGFCLESKINPDTGIDSTLLEIVYNTFPALLIAIVTVWATIKAGKWASRRELSNKKRESLLRAAEEYNLLVHEYKRDISRIISGDFTDGQLRDGEILSKSLQTGLEFLRERSYIESILWVSSQEKLSKNIDRNIGCFDELRKISIYFERGTISGPEDFTKEDISFVAEVLVQKEITIMREFRFVFENV